jgi:hypothetical protein|tara:strand:+ start:148 stop:360 length:213 start_codon:yes stop_codon:yes gene_type:complete
MRIIKHFNPHFPERETYKCTIRYTTKFGTLDEVNQWRDDQMENEAEYKRIEELTRQRAGEYYKTLTYKGD